MRSVPEGQVPGHVPVEVEFVRSVEPEELAKSATIHIGGPLGSLAR